MTSSIKGTESGQTVLEEITTSEEVVQSQLENKLQQMERIK